MGQEDRRFLALNIKGISDKAAEGRIPYSHTLQLSIDFKVVVTPEVSLTV